MFEVKKSIDGENANLELIGELNTLTSKDFKAEVEGFIDNVKSVHIDMKDLTYITSAGLRVLLWMDESLEEEGAVTVTNVSENVMDVFELTGFDNVLNIVND